MASTKQKPLSDVPDAPKDRINEEDFPESWGAVHTPNVEIREHHPHTGRVTICAWSDGALTARTFECSMRAFIRACNEFADRMEQSRVSKTAAKAD